MCARNAHLSTENPGGGGEGADGTKILGKGRRDSKCSQVGYT